MTIGTSTGGSSASPECRPEADLRLHPLLVAVFFAQIGVALVVLPWSALWDHNLLLEWSARIHELTRSAYVRGAISGLGLVNIAIAVREAFDAWQRHEDAGTPGVLSPFDEARRGRA